MSKNTTVSGNVIRFMSQIIRKAVPNHAKLCILVIYAQDFVSNRKQKLLIDFDLLQARRSIALA